MDAIIWIQNSPLATWIREAFWPFPVILSIHVAAMGLLAGTGFLTGLRLLGLGAGIPLSALQRFRPVTWLALIVIALSGALLFASYPAKAVTNALFYFKLAGIGLAVWLTLRIDARFLRGGEVGGRIWGAALIGVWAFVICAGRLLAYTYSFNNLLW